MTKHKFVDLGLIKSNVLTLDMRLNSNVISLDFLRMRFRRSYELSIRLTSGLGDVCLSRNYSVE